MFMKSFISDQVRIVNPTDTYSFLQGFLACGEAFAVWKDGEQLLGDGMFDLKDLKEAVREYILDQSLILED